MIRNDGKLICDKEVGHYSRGWHSCKRLAVVGVPSKHSVGMTLHYCPKHSPKRNTNVGQQLGVTAGRVRYGFVR